MTVQRDDLILREAAALFSGLSFFYLALMKVTATQAENVPVPPLAVLASLPLPGPLPDVEADKLDGEADDKKEDDPLDLLPDEEPLLDEPLPEPDKEPLPDWDSGAEPLCVDVPAQKFGRTASDRITLSRSASAKRYLGRAFSCSGSLNRPV